MNGMLYHDYPTEIVPAFNNITTITIGCANTKTNYQSNCLLNDFRIYDHALSPREVKEISKGLVLHYPLSMPGGENLIKNSSLFQTTDYWANNQNVAYSVENEELKAVINQNNSTPGLKYTESLSLPSGEYTATVIAKVENGNKDYITYPFYIANISTGGYERERMGNGYYRYSNTFFVSSTVSATLYIITSGSKVGETWYIKSVKLERGSRPTPWLPNPADTKYTILGFNDNIEYDVSGYGNNGTRNGTFSWSSDTPRYETSAVFDGSSDIRSAKSSFGWFDFKEGTVAAWFKPANTTQTWASVGVQNDAGAGSRSFSICNYSGKAATVVGYDSSWGN